ncbi:MAG: hypothetical protein HWD81_00770 [Marivivens sp.]|nr:hypothetical protein [Marivivens sp.]
MATNVRTISLAITLSMSLCSVALAESAEISLAQGHVMARQALLSGDFGFAMDLALALLDADPDDADALAILATGLIRAGDYPLARSTAHRAYLRAEAGLQSYEAARIAALAAKLDNRFTLSQLWLRRAANHAELPSLAAQTAQDYKQVAAQNPLWFRANVSVRRSDNVNGGSDTALNVIDGVPWVGTLSAEAQALSGTVASGRISARYRIDQSSEHLTALTGQLLTQNVFLSDEAQASAPSLTDADLSSYSLTAGIEHRQKWEDLTTTTSVEVGQVWSGDAKSYDLARLGAGLSYGLLDNAALSATVRQEMRFDQTGSGNDDEVTTFGAGITAIAQAGIAQGRWSAGVNHTITESPTANRANTASSLYASFAPNMQGKPVQLQASVGRAVTLYDDYALPPVFSGERRDETSFAVIEAAFPNMTYAGFMPVISLRSVQTESNISRFTRSETGIEIGYRSSF